MGAPKIMRDASHTFTGLLREAVETWRKASGWSRETVVMHIVEAHERLGGPAATSIVFDPPTRDTFERAKVNADRVFRWLDDVTKDTNTCPANFIPSILAALPLDRRLALVNLWLNPLQIGGRPLHPGQADDLDAPVRLFKDLVHTSAAAQSSVAELLDGIDPGELESAQAALGETLRSVQTALSVVERRLATSMAAPRVIVGGRS